MALPPLASDSVTVVLRGQVPIADLSPRWLHDKGLIGDSELAQAKHLLLLPGEVNNFSADWLTVTAQSGTLQVSTDREEEFERLRDVAAGILAAFPDAPLVAMGMNRAVHFVAPSREAYHRIGDSLVPKQHWSETLGDAALKSLTLVGPRADSYGGRVEVKIEPSNVFGMAVFVTCNDHYDLTLLDKPIVSRDDLKLDGAAEEGVEKNLQALTILNEEWGSSLARSMTIFEQVGALGLP
ncbi:hypothetical protein [Asanoa siamensis]|uniref:TIGR04255 family protein n=1 Tax=Asanoa siamensis TaxID=926357 RepID=A0ABQ4CK87_9ACTN|nr:hypothetical protein [Asanoa siamensis]GIF71705.1 hypothetical protein Asi02nite_12230 [Asanoa siamensis]